MFTSVLLGSQSAQLKSGVKFHTEFVSLLLVILWIQLCEEKSSSL